MTMAVNALRGEATLEAGDKAYRLVFDVNAFCYAEERLAKTTDEIVAEVSTEFASWNPDALSKGGVPRINATLTRALLWAGLQKHHAGTHLAEAGEIMSAAGLNGTVAAVLNGFYAAFGQAEGEDGSRPPEGGEAAPGTG